MVTSPVVIVHDYLTQRGGAERVVLSMHRAFPEAPIFTSFYDPESTYPEFAEADIRVAGLNRVTLLRRHHRLALPLLATVFSKMRVDARVAICSSSGWAHGAAVTGRKVVYCYTPARWLYQTDAYVGADQGGLRRAAVALLGGRLRTWDAHAAAGAARYLTLSSATQQRIASAYGIEAEVLPPPYTLTPDGYQVAPPGLVNGDPGFGLCVSRLLPYKNVAAIVEAMRSLPELRLVIAGDGPEAPRLRRLAPTNVHMVGGVSDDQLRWLYARAAWLVAASFEDFGLTPLEAAAFGHPAAVLRWGGFLDTVIEDRTGVFFDRPEPDAIGEALSRIESHPWDADLIRSHAQRYTEGRFIGRLRQIVEEELARPAQ